jgi:hypothetical protein
MNQFPPAAMGVQILLTDVVCTGQEEWLSNCSQQSHEGECMHSEDVRLVCLPPETTPG